MEALESDDQVAIWIAELLMKLDDSIPSTRGNVR
jgi:hypothetical protein